MKNINTMNLIEEIKKDTEEIIEKNQVAPITVEGYQAYIENGNRLQFERQYFERRRQLVTLGLALLLDDNNLSNIRMLEKIMWEVCNEYTWALPAHLDYGGEAAYDRDSPYMVDLFSAETAQTLSELIEIHGNSFSQIVKSRVESEIERRVLKPFERKEWEWEHLENNWSAVIASCIGMTALSMLKSQQERQEKIIKRLSISFDSYFRSFENDGVCEEGIGYWIYGFGYYCYFAEKYQQNYQSDQFLSEPLLKKIAAFPFYTQIGNRSFVPFSDAENPELPSGLISFCHRYFQVPVPFLDQATSLHFDHCYRWAHLSRNLLWTGTVENEQAEGVHYFSDAEWLVANFKEEKVVFAAKGGSNNESHNHNDVGHFIFGSQEELLLTDLGAGEYTRGYFLEETRYSILNNRSLGHSVPIINGCEQIVGDHQAEKVEFTESADGFRFSMNLEGVYGKESQITDYHRKWQWVKDEKMLFLQDEIHFNRNMNNKVLQNFISHYQPLIQENKISWKGEKCQVDLFFSDKLDEARTIREEYRTHQGDIREVYRLVLSAKKLTNNYKRKYKLQVKEN